MTKSRGINRQRRKWSEEEILLLTHLYKNTYSISIAKLLDRTLSQVYNMANKLKLHKSIWYMKSPMSQALQRDSSIGIGTRFKKGSIPHNKGIKQLSHPNSVKSQFKPGSTPVNLKPVGSTRIDAKDGYLLMKIGDGVNSFKPIHRIIYERMHGKVPAGFVTYFVDKNKLNISITNISIISKKDNAIRNSIHRYGKEIAQLSQLKAQITRQINKRESKNERHIST